MNFAGGCMTPLRKKFLTGVLAVCAFQTHAEARTIIELTQVPCQFLESEGGTDHQFKSISAEDCIRQNGVTAAARLASADPIILKPGSYTFRVTNRNVPYPLGFWLRGKSLLGRATLPSVSGGGMTTGTTIEYRIDLKPGEYLYSCPLNPTPDYALIVRE
tara:strand:+ start:1336 stop:1815 length:480 start_codon:yes stop_codon:yes gene_type:complete